MPIGPRMGGAFGQFQYPTPPLARPGGAQAVFHHEWKKEEAKEKLKRTVEAYRQFEQGQLPAGPGADALLAAFRAVETELGDHDAGPAKVVTDRQIELLLKQKASVLHQRTTAGSRTRRRRCVSS
jgi:hypothetical protein